MDENLEPEVPQTPEAIMEKLSEEVAEVYWDELKLPFAKGDVLWGDLSLDIVKVGLALAMDDKELIADMMSRGVFGKIKDSTAKLWYAEKDFKVRALGLKPWILVQSY
jgi:hypothetical protein